MHKLSRLLLLLTVTLAQAGHAAAPAVTTLPETRVSLAGESFSVEIAHTRAQRTQGLMFRASMPTDRGMLFLFPQPRPMAFWMKNTLIPLDILFFDQQGQLLSAYRNAPPCQQQPCRTYPSGTPAAMVLELNGGRSAEMPLSGQSRLVIENRDSLPVPE